MFTEPCRCRLNMEIKARVREVIGIETIGQRLTSAAGDWSKGREIVGRQHFIGPEGSRASKAGETVGD